MRNLYFKQLFLIPLPLVVLVLSIYFLYLERQPYKLPVHLSEKQRILKYNIDTGIEIVGTFFSFLLYTYFIFCFVFLLEIFGHYAEIILIDRSRLFILFVMIFDLILFIFLCFLRWRYEKLQYKLNKELNSTKVWFGSIVYILILSVLCSLIYFLHYYINYE